MFNDGSSQFAYVYQTVAGAAANAGGLAATVGVQAATTGSLFTRHSFNTASLTGGQRLAAAIPACTSGTGQCVLPDLMFSNGFEP